MTKQNNTNHFYQTRKVLTCLDRARQRKPIQTIFYAAGGDMKTEIEFDSSKDLIIFTLRGENASEIALLRILKTKQPKVQWIEHGPETYSTWSYPLAQFSIALKEAPLKVLAASSDGVLYGPVIEGAKRVDDV